MVRAYRQWSPRTPSSDSISPQSSPERIPIPPKFKGSTSLPESIALSISKLTAPRPPPPKPHRQILDPQLKKEIASLQGLPLNHEARPGPGIKGFKMIPSKTKSSLHERFTLNKNDSNI